MTDHQVLLDAVIDYHQAFERILTLHAVNSRRSACKECCKPWPCPTTVAAMAPHQKGVA